MTMSYLDLLKKAEKYDEEMHLLDIDQRIDLTQSFKQKYRSFYDDVKINLKEDW